MKVICNQEEGNLYFDGPFNSVKLPAGYLLKTEGGGNWLVEKVSAPIWNGEGLPPVGTPVENNLHGPVVVLAHGTHRGGGVVICQGHDTIITCTPDTLAPIPTAEQIAAEKRKDEVSAMYKLFYSEGDTGMQAMFRLYDAGYRKQEQSK